MIDYTEVLALDVGEKRIGLARANSVARLAEPLCTVINDDRVIDELEKIISEFGVDLLVIGLPRNLASNDTDQTRYSRAFADKLEPLDMPIVWQDEALSSKQARDLIKRRVYRKNDRGQKVGVDEVAACIILNDFLGENN